MENEKKMVDEKFDSAFHKKYVGGVGSVDEGPVKEPKHHWYEPVTAETKYDLYEEVLKDYREYVRDNKADLPEEVKEDLKKLGIVKNEGDN